MEAPLCEICLKSDMLCPGCAEKIERGLISDEDVNVARIIYKISQEHKSLQDLNFSRTISTKDLLLIVVSKGEVENFVKKSGKLIKILSKKLKKRVRVMEETNDLKDLARDLLRPARVLGINVLYCVDGDQRFNISLERNVSRKLPTSKNELEKLLESFSGKKVSLKV